MSSDVGTDTAPIVSTEESLTNSKKVKDDNNNTLKTSSGTTSVIRKKLKFTDETLWKTFSSRRLQLVESLSLSSKKASEQEEEIRACATQLMHEFEFDDDTLPEFDKLVRLAIQSVRRNKKRSEKRLASKLEILTSDDEQFQHSIKRTRFDTDEHDSDNKDTDHDEMDHDHLEHHHDIEHDNSTNNLNLLSTILIEADHNEKLSEMGNNHTHNDILATPKSASAVMDFSMINKEPKESENMDSRFAINSLVGPVIQDTDKLPSIKKLDENPEFTNASQKILHSIKRSKSCFEFSKNSGTEYSRTQNYDLLEEFGSGCINAAVLFTLEKWFDHLLPDSSSYIKLRLKSDLTMGLIIKNLDKQSVEVNGLNNYVASQLFKKLIGGCVKDFGFDSTLNPLCDIFHSIILKDYPIIAKDQIRQTKTTQTTERKDNFFNDLSIIDSTFNQSKTTPNLDVFSTSPINSTATPAVSLRDNDSSTDINKMLYSHSSNSEVPDFPLSTAHIPIPSPNMSTSLIAPPPILRPKHYSNVTIKFKDKELKFRYCMDSNAPPTVLELITNCKQAFGIVNSTRILNLKDVRSANLLKTDHELERVLRMAAMLSKDGTGEVMLELVFTNVTQGYLNLNYESTTKSKIIDDDILLPDSSSITTTPANITKDIPPNPLNNNNNNSESSLIGRYLPPPRPNVQPRNVFMKFQPLL